MKYEAILHVVYWDAPLESVLISDAEMFGNVREEFILECRFFHEYLKAALHFKWSLASGNVYSATAEGGWEKTEPDKLEVKQVVESDSTFLLSCEGILSKDCTPWMPEPDYRQHFIRTDHQSFNLIVNKRENVGEKIHDLNRRYWGLEVGVREMVD